MNNKKKILFGGSLQPNTFIGNMANLYPTAADLAAVLSVTADQISVFKVVGNDIQCYIGVDYDALAQDSFSSGCTYYNDEQGRLKNIGAIFRFNSDLTDVSMINLETCSRGTFNGTNIQLAEFPVLLSISSTVFPNTSNLRYAILRNLLSIISSNNFSGTTSLEVCYIPECLTIGGDTTDDLNFLNTNVNCVFYVNAAVMTSNAGNPNPDIQYLIDRGNEVRVVTDFTVPNNVTDLRILDNTYYDAFSIEWSAPSSTNVIDWYAIYVNGNFYGRTVGNETNYTFYDLDQEAQYAIQVVAVDYFFNRSLLSNILTLTTSNLESYPRESITTYYNFNNNVNDSVGINNGIPTNIAYASAKAGDGSVFNFSTSQIVLPDSDVFSFISVPFTISYFIKFNSQPSVSALIIKDLGGVDREFIIDYNSTGFRTLLWDANNSNASLRAETTTPITVGDWYHVIHKFDGGVLASGIGTYINGLPQSLTVTEDPSFVSMVNTLADVEVGNWNLVGIGSRVLDGELDGLSFMNGVAVNDSEALAMYNKQNDGFELI